MNTLSELVYVLNYDRPKSFDTFLSRTSKTRQLFDAIENNTVTTDAEASQFIYNTNPGDKRYLMLKKNLKEKLMEMVLLLDNDTTPGSISSKFQLKKKLAVTEMLLMQNVYHNAEKILLKVLAEASNLALTDIQIESMRQLRFLNFLKGVPDQIRLYDTELQLLIRQMEYEEKSQAMWEILMSDQKYLLQTSFEIYSKAEEFYKEIKQGYSRIKSVVIKLFELKIRLLIEKYNKRYDKSILTIDEIDTLLKSYPYLNNTNRQLEQYLEWARYYRNNGYLSDALEYVDMALELANYKAFNKFEAKVLQTELLLKSGQFEKAHRIIEEVAATPQFEYLHPNDKACWYILEGYVLVAAYLNNEQIGTFVFDIYQQKNMIQALEQACRSINKDKTGYNLQLVILKFLLLIITTGFKLDWDTGFIKVYSQRYVKNSPENRTHHFLKILMKVAGLGTSVIVEEEIQKIYKKIDKPEDYAYDICEILPYQFIINGLLVKVKKTG